MEWFSQNWVWVLFFAGIIAMHIFGLVDGATDATRVITDGATIVVDGTAGMVEL